MSSEKCLLFKSFLNFLKKYFYTYGCFACMYVIYHVDVQCPRSQKSMWDPLRLELQIVLVWKVCSKETADMATSLGVGGYCK